MSMNFTAEYLNLLASYKGLTDLFAIKKDGDSIKVASCRTKNKASLKSMALVVEAPKRHFDVGDDVAFADFGRFYNMMQLVTRENLEKAKLVPLKTDEGIAGIEFAGANGKGKYGTASLQDLSVKSNLWIGKKYKDSRVTKIPEELIKAKFDLSKEIMSEIFSFGDSVDSKTVKVVVKDGKRSFVFDNPIDGNDISSEPVDCDAAVDCNVTFSLESFKTLPKADYKADLALTLISLEQAMPPVGEGENAKPSDIKARVVIVAISSDVA